MTASSALAALAFLLGGYRFSRYLGKKDKEKTVLGVPDGMDKEDVRRQANAVYLARDLINTPTNDMGPEQLEKAVRRLAKDYKADVSVTKGDQLLKHNFPMIHAVGRAGAEEPRLIDLVWGAKNAPKVTLVGKGV